MQVANVLSSDVLARVGAEGCARARVGVSAREREVARLGGQRGPGRAVALLRWVGCGGPLMR